MKANKHSSILKNMTLVFVLMIHANSYCQNLDTMIVKTVILDRNDIVYLKNPNLDVDINTWDKNELKIEYHLSIETKTNKDLKQFYLVFEEMLLKHMLEINSGKVFVNVQFDSFSQINDKVKIKFKDNAREYDLEKFEGSIVIYMPRNNSLNAQSNFHKLNIGSLNADASIDIASTNFSLESCKKLDLKSSFSKNMRIGKTEFVKIEMNSSDADIMTVGSDFFLTGSFSDIEVGSIGDKAVIDLNSSSFKISDIKSLDLKGSFIRSFKANNIGEAKIQINSSKFEAKKINSVVVDKATFSTLKIDEIGDIDIGVSSSSKFYFETANSINANNCSFSDFNIGNLTSLFTIAANSTEVLINNVEKGFDKIHINGKFLTANVNVSKGCEYLISADLIFPNYDFGNINIKKQIKDMSHEVIDGYNGLNEKANSSIKFNCLSSRITVK